MRPLQRLSLITAALLAGLAAVTAPAASAAPAWLPPFDVAPGAFGRAAVNGAGDAVAVWRGADGINSIVRAATRRAGAPFSAGFDLSAPGANAEAAEVAINAKGDTVAVWMRNGVIQAATGTAASGFSAPVDVSVGSGAGAPQVAIDDAATIVVVWIQGARIKTSTRPAGSIFSAPANLSAAGLNADAPRVAANGAGHTVAVWRRYATGAVIQASVRPPGGSFSPPDDLSAPGGTAETPQVAVDAQGNGIAVWRVLNGTTWEIQAASQPAGAAFGGPVSVSGLGKNANSPQVAAGGAGDAVVAWAREKPGPPGSPDEIQAATRTAGGSFTAPADLSGGTPGGPSSHPQVAIDPAGNAVVAWKRLNTLGYPDLHASLRPPGGAFSAVMDVSAPGAYVLEQHVAMDGSGNVLALWTAIPPGKMASAVQAAVYDVSPPRTGEIAMPAAGVAGVPVDFTIAPFDAWSSVSSAWSFGDGAGASGAAVSRAFAAPGTYRVGVVVTDAAGNVAETAREIAITAKSPSQAAPSISRLRISPRAFSRRARVTFRLDRAATVGFRVLRRTRRGRFVAVNRRFARASTAGANRLTFRRRALRPGRYRLTAVPSAGGVRGRRAGTAFRVRASSRAGA